MCFKKLPLILSMLLVTDLIFVMTNLVYCRYGCVTVCNFVYCDKSLGNQIVFCKKSCIQYAVKFVNAVTVPITCNHPKIDIINPGFPLATPRFLIRFLAWTKLAQAKLWVSHCICNYSNHVYNSTFIAFLSANIQHCINNIGPRLFYCCANVAQVLSHYWAKEHLPAPSGAP